MMSQVLILSQGKLKLADDLNNFLGLMLAAHWQREIAVISRKLQ